MDYKIDRDIPIPNPEETKGRKPSFPLMKMEVGDSFFVAGGQDCVARRLAIATWRLAPKKFQISRRAENGVKGARCWRIE